MDLTICLIFLGIMYCVLLFFDMFFKSCAHYPYLRLLNGTGLTIKPLQIHWETTAFNRTFLRWGNTLKILDGWFTFGLYVTLLLLPVSVIILLIAIGQNLFYRSRGGTNSVLIEPLIPGVNLPGSELGYYSLSLILSSAVHELGHALASVKEDVHIVNVGVKVIFVLPIAFVELSSECLNSLNPWKALKILCAGVWHNIILSSIAYVLYTSLPLCYTSVFRLNQGVYVKGISARSPLLGERGLDVSDVITEINGCRVLDEEGLYDCLRRAYMNKPGFCVDADTVHGLDESVPLRHTEIGLDCCDGSDGGLCFEYIERMDGVLEIPPHVCLPARLIIETSKLRCDSRTYCPHKLHCIRPLLENTTALMKISRMGKPDVVYIGHPGDVVQTVDTSSYIPKYGFSAIFAPDTVIKFLEYVMVISTGLAVVNVIPCLFMDGQHITDALTQIVLKDHSKENSRAVATFISLTSTFLLLAHCVYTIFSRLF